MKEGTGEGCVNIDLDGDGQITEGKTVYLWYGEDKTNNTRTGRWCKMLCFYRSLQLDRQGNSTVSSEQHPAD